MRTPTNVHVEQVSTFGTYLFIRFICPVPRVHLVFLLLLLLGAVLGHLLAVEVTRPRLPCLLNTPGCAGTAAYLKSINEIAIAWPLSIVQSETLILTGQQPLYTKNACGRDYPRWFPLNADRTWHLIVSPNAS